MAYSGATPTSVPLSGDDLSDGIISEAKLGTDAVSLAKMKAGTDGNIISYDASGNVVAIATGSDGQVLTSSGAGSPCAFETAAAGGKLLQVVNVQTGATASNTGVMYMDGSIPQIGEGAEFMSLAVTAADASNILEITVYAQHSCNAGTHNMFGFLFAVGTSNALAGMIYTQEIANYMGIISFKHRMAAGGTSAITFKYRAGALGGTTRFNGNNDGVRAGGTCASSITIKEISA